MTTINILQILCVICCSFANQSLASKNTNIQTTAAVANVNKTSSQKSTGPTCDTLKSIPVEVFADITLGPGIKKRFSKVINFDVDLHGDGMMNQSAPKHDVVVYSVEELEVHHLLYRLHAEVGGVAQKDKVVQIQSLMHRMTSGSPHAQRTYINPHLQGLCEEEFDKDPALRNSNITAKPKLLACLMGAAGGYHGNHKCHQIEEGKAYPTTSGVACASLVRCGIAADGSHNGKIDDAERPKYDKCLKAHDVEPKYGSSNVHHWKVESNSVTIEETHITHGTTSSTKQVPSQESAEERLSAYNNGPKPKDADIFKIGYNHWRPNLWVMAQNKTGGKHDAFKCRRKSNVQYRWRESSGKTKESITTLSDQMHNRSTAVPKEMIIISGVEGEEWFITKKTFSARYDRVQKFGTLSQNGMAHGTCYAKKGSEARAIRMKWKFDIYRNDSNHPERGQEGWYLLQNQERDNRGYAPIHPVIFGKAFDRLTAEEKPAPKSTKSVGTKPSAKSTKSVGTKPAPKSTKSVGTKPAPKSTKSVGTKPAPKSTKSVGKKLAPKSATGHPVEHKSKSTSQTESHSHSDTRQTSQAKGQLINKNGVVDVKQETHIEMEGKSGVAGLSQQKQHILSKDSQGRVTEKKKDQLAFIQGKQAGTHNQTETLHAVKDKSGHVKAEYSQQQRSQGMVEGELHTLKLEQSKGPNGEAMRLEKQRQDVGRKGDAASHMNTVVEGQMDETGKVTVEKIKASGTAQVEEKEDKSAKKTVEYKEKARNTGTQQLG